MNPIRLLNFTCYPQPDDNRQFAVADAFDLLIAAHDETSSHKACIDMLFALGNAHAGTYCPIAVLVIPYFGDILREGAPWAQYSVLEVLYILNTSTPDFRYALFRGEHLRRLVIQETVKLLTIIRPITETESVGTVSAVDVCELLQELVSEMQLEINEATPSRTED